MFEALKARYFSAKNVGKKWWAFVFGAYGLFWLLDAAIEKWNVLGLKIWWDAHTQHLPSTWQSWMVGLLVVALLLVLDWQLSSSGEVRGADRLSHLAIRSPRNSF